MSKKVLVISGHTNLKEDSLANKTILNSLKNELLPEAEYRFLSDLYPDYQIDVNAEQEKLVNADIIVLQYPIFWYSTLSLLSKWFEDVFVFGFSHGTGEALKGKKLIVSLTTGAPEAAYTKEAGATIEDLLAPIRQTAQLTKMDFEGHIVTYGVSFSMRNNPDLREQMVERAEKHATEVAQKVKDLN